MIRLTLALLCVMFLTFAIAGTDRGQVRYGLMSTGAAPALAQTLTPGTLPGAEPEAEVLAAAFQNPQQDEAVVERIEAVYVPVEILIPPPEPEPILIETAAPETDLQPLVRYIAVASANVREGPSKDFAVLERLARGEAVSVVAASEEVTGWTLIRIEGDGIEGYISTSLLADQP